MNIKDHPIYKEVAQAYYDCMHQDEPWEQTSKERQLYFRASESVDRDTAIAILEETVPGYNSFSPELLEVLPKDCQITIAREGSVCLYVKGLTKKVSLGDEFDRRGDEIRIWWD